jgi:hypothetical protein
MNTARRSGCSPLGPVARLETETVGNAWKRRANAWNTPLKPIFCLFDVGPRDMNHDLYTRGATGPRGWRVPKHAGLAWAMIGVVSGLA